MEHLVAPGKSAGVIISGLPHPGLTLYFIIYMSAFSVFRRWPIASWLFVLHAAFVLAIYVMWATDSSVERGMIWMTVFILDWPSSYLFVDRPGATGLLAISAIFIGGLQWALVGALCDLLRRLVRRKQQSRNTKPSSSR